MRLCLPGQPCPPAGLQAATTQSPAGLCRQPGTTEIGPLALGIPGAVAAAAVGHLGLTRDRIGVLNAVLDDLRPVGEYELSARPGILPLVIGLGGGLLLSGADPGDHRGS